MHTKKPAFLNCSYHTAGIAFIITGILFLSAGCAALYRTIGLTDEQTADQVSKDQTDRQEIVEEIRLTTTELITTAIAGLGAIASGFLAKWLNTERKITTALITGVEGSDGIDVKSRITTKATAAGVESKLNARVRALT